MMCQDIKEAIWQSRNSKALENDQITAEILKADTQISVNYLCNSLMCGMMRSFRQCGKGE